MVSLKEHCVPLIEPNSFGIRNFSSDFDTISLISSVFLGRNKYFGPKISFITLQTSDNVFETVHWCTPNVMAVIYREPVSFK